MQASPRIDFVISNPGHHLDTALPVIEELARSPGYGCRLLSLCELRGFETPRPTAVPVEIRPLLRRRFRSPSTLGRGAGAPGGGRRLLHALGWRLLLAPPLRRALARPPGLVVVPNDAAFPYDRLTGLLRRRRVPFLLLQEGMRFPLPGERSGGAYGAGGAAAVAAWGESSAAFFRARGVPDERIALTGCPRFDAVAARDWTEPAEALRRRLGLGAEVLLLLSNPIDDQGFCSSGEKWRLLGRFIEELAPLQRERGLHLVVKLHRRESAAILEARLAASPPPGPVTVLREEPLYPLLSLARAAVVLASTAGLEALLLGLPLGVLEIPGHGFVHDYVSRGAAAGLRPDGSLAADVRRLLEPDGEHRQGAERYLRDNLACRGGAARRVAELIRCLAEP